MKKSATIITALVCLLFLFSLNPKAATKGNYKYNVNSDKTITIVGYTGHASTLKIPSKINGKRVKTIGNEAFYDCPQLKIVIIPKSVKTIGMYAFGYYSYSSTSQYSLSGDTDSEEEVSEEYDEVPEEDSVEEIDAPYTKVPGFEIHSYSGTAAESYAEVNSFKFVPIKTKIGSTRTVKKNKYVLTSANTVKYKEPGSKKVKNVTIPKKVRINKRYYKVTAIGKKAFSKCKKLKKVVIPTTVEKIGASAFYKCKKLRTIKIKTKKLTLGRIGKSAFKKIHTKAVFYLPASKKSAYKAILLKKGAAKTMTFK